MSTSAKLIQSYQTNTWLIGKQAAGLSHDDSVIQLPFRSNCFNWVLGHMLVSRDRVLRLLAQEAVLTDEQTVLYESESAPIVDASRAAPFEKLLSAVSESQARIESGLQNATDDKLSAPVSEENGQTVADRISGLHWHETYHLGQLEILRQAAGKDDKVV